MNREECIQDREWTEEEKRALIRLAGERHPSRSLEERTVRRLRQEGLLANRSVRWWHAPRVAWIGAAAAAAGFFFLLGVQFGQRWGAETTAELLTAQHRDDIRSAESRVQATGSAYVEAMTALAALASNRDPQEMGQAREAALSAFYGAATQLVALDPNDPVAVRLLQGIEEFDKRSPGEKKPERKVYWF